MNAVMFRLLGRNHAVCWLESGAVLEVRILINDNNNPVRQQEDHCHSTGNSDDKPLLPTITSCSSATASSSSSPTTPLASTTTAATMTTSANTATSAITHKTMAELMQNPPHMLGPVPVQLFPPFEWDAASGVLRVHAIEKQQLVC